MRDAGGGDGSSSGGQWEVGSGEVVAVQQQWQWQQIQYGMYVCSVRAGVYGRRTRTHGSSTWIINGPDRGAPSGWHPSLREAPLSP